MIYEFTEEQKRILKAIDEDYEKKIGDKSSLIPLLQAAQNRFGYLSLETIEAISALVGPSKSDVYGVITFYAQFRLTKQGEKVCKVCDGTACHVNGATKIYEEIKEYLELKDGEDTSSDGAFTLEKAACLGCCSLAPAMMIDDEVYGRLNPKKAKKIIQDLRPTREK